MKKKWMVKYVLAIVLGVILAVILSNVLTGLGVVVNPWYIWLLPLAFLSIIMVWKIIRRYITLTLSKVDVGDKAYTLLFKCMLIIGGAILMIPLLVVGFILAILHAIKEYTLARDEYEEGQKAQSEPQPSEDAEPVEAPVKSPRKNWRRRAEIAGNNGASDEVKQLPLPSADGVIKLSDPEISGADNDVQEEP